MKQAKRNAPTADTLGKLRRKIERVVRDDTIDDQEKQARVAVAMTDVFVDEDPVLIKTSRHGPYLLIKKEHNGSRSHHWISKLHGMHKIEDIKAMFAQERKQTARAR